MINLNLILGKISDVLSEDFRLQNIMKRKRSHSFSYKIMLCIFVSHTVF